MSSHRATAPTKALAFAVAASLILSLLLAACGGSAPAATQAATAAATAAATEAATTEAAAAAGGATAAAPATEALSAAAQAAASAPTVAPPAEVSQGSASKVKPESRANMYKAEPPMSIDPNKYYYATFKTAKGDIKVQLFADRAPKTVNNFVYLAKDGFYNDTTFHRVIDGFMAQGGDPTGTGSGGPGYQFADEIFPGAKFDRPNLLAMANAGPGTNGSQFFMTYAPTEWLNGQHTIFGEVVEGQDVLNKITRRDPQANPTTPGDLLYTVTIEETDKSQLPTPTPLPPTPTPFAPSSVKDTSRPLAALPGSQKAGYFNQPPTMVIDTAKTYTATIKTSKGDMVMALNDDKAPVAVNNFVVLSDLGFYDGTPINDTSSGQIVVAGSPNNNPNDDAGYRIQPEVGLPISPTLGSVAYRSLDRDAAGKVIASSSQLFMVVTPPPADVNANYSFFGQIVQGADILPKLTMSDTIQSVVISSK